MAPGASSCIVVWDVTALAGSAILGCDFGWISRLGARKSANAPSPRVFEALDRGSSIVEAYSAPVWSAATEFGARGGALWVCD